MNARQWRQMQKPSESRANLKSFWRRQHLAVALIVREGDDPQFHSTTYSRQR